MALIQRAAILAVAGLLALAGCGSDEDPDAPSASSPGDKAATEGDDTARQKDGAAGSDTPRPAAKGTAVRVGRSEFGSMLFSSSRQAIYIFQNDRKDKSVCYGECAAAWPPVFTEGRPKAGAGVEDSLLGTTKRRDGKLQVTYRGQPLYFYAHEGPGEVRCHNVNLNGGLWWVVGPDGKRRP